MATTLVPDVKSHGFSRLFNDRKIGTKIIIGFSVVLVIMMVISALAYYEFSKVRRDVSDYSHKASVYSLVGEIDREFVAFRRYIGEVSENVEENSKSAEKARATVRARLEEVMKSINSPERLAKMKHLLEQFEVYSKDYDKVRPLQREQVTLVKEVLDPVGVRLRLDFEELQKASAAATGNSNTSVLTGEAIKLVMLLRLNSERALARHDPEVFKASEKAFADLNAVMPAIEKSISDANLRKRFDQIRSNVNKYHDAFVKAAHDSEEISKLMHGEMRKAAREIAADAEAMKAALAAEEKQIEHEVADLIAFASTFILCLAIGGILVGGLFAWFIGRAISKPVQGISATLMELTNDRIVDVPYTDRRDEIGDIARATDVFKDSIAEKVTNFRIKSALDIITSNVMMADADYDISYMNQSMLEMMREAEVELRKVLPQFDSSKLIGSNIDIFHKNPAHQRRMLDSLSGSFKTNIAVGTQKFFLIATAVVDKHGKRIGTVVEWKNETVEKAIEEEVGNLVSAAASGDFSNRIPVEGKQGFMLNLTNAMNSLCGTISTVLDDLVAMLGALAGGDLTKRIDAQYQGTFGKLKDDANAMAEKLTEIVSQIKAGSGEVANAAAEISTGTTDLSQRTEEQAASLEETSASMEEISATVKKNAENAQQANQSAGSTREVASRGGEVVAQAVDAMSRIEESSRKISDIISVIDEIARQTNLLALNAAVEAARAGDAGRGFAVVASEVRSLAQRSSQAAKDIKDLINNSTSQVKDGVDLVNRAGEQLKEIVESIKGVAAIVSEIANASAEQASGIEQVNKALTQMDEVTQQNSALVEENAASAKTLEQQAAAMNERVGFFKLAEGATAVPQRETAAAPKAAAPAARPQAVAVKRNGAASGANGVHRGPVARIQTALATALKDDPEWKEF